MGVMMEYMSLLMDLLIKKKTLWPQLPQSYRATKRRQRSFYHLVPKNYCTHLIDFVSMKG